jgi:hypothetical protein
LRIMNSHIGSAPHGRQTTFADSTPQCRPFQTGRILVAPSFSRLLHLISVMGSGSRHVRTLEDFPSAAGNDPERTFEFVDAMA